MQPKWQSRTKVTFVYFNRECRQDEDNGRVGIYERGNAKNIIILSESYLIVH